MKTVAIILVAGKSTRFDSNISKQVFLLKNKPVFTYSLNSFNNCKLIDKICLVTNKDHYDEINSFVINNNMNKVDVILGGETRQESVANGLKALADCSDDDIVLIHDGARPLIDEEIIMRTIDATKNYGAVTTCLSMEDTVAVSDQGNSILEFIDRRKLIRVQTPQGFKFSLINDAHKHARNNLATDDCSLVMALPHQVKLIDGSKKLTKLTTIDDVKYLETFLK